jgi:hypothetical protein
MCNDAAHAPLACELRETWRQIQIDAGLRSSWVEGHTKHCPNCDRRIEKNDGCNHMTCPAKPIGCGYQFCWICGWKWPHDSEHPCLPKLATETGLIKVLPKFDEIDLLRQCETRFLAAVGEADRYQQSRVVIQQKLLEASQSGVDGESLRGLFAEEGLGLLDFAMSMLCWCEPYTFFLPKSSRTPELQGLIDEVQRTATECLEFTSQPVLALWSFQRHVSLLRKAIDQLLERTEQTAVSKE